MNENQSVVLWGLATDTLPLADPPVLQAPTGGEVVWFPEDGSLKNFLLLMLHWQAAMGGLPFSAVGSAESFDVPPTWKVCAQVHEMTAYASPGAALCIIRNNGNADVFLGALDSSVFDTASAKLPVRWDHSSAHDR